MPGTLPGYSGKRTFPCYPGPPRKLIRSRLELLDHDQVPALKARDHLNARRTAAKARGNAFESGPGLTGVEDRAAPYGHKGQAPLERYRGPSQGPSDGGPVHVPPSAPAVLLGASAHDRQVRERHRVHAQEIALPTVRLEKDDLDLRKDSGERDARGAATGADVDERPTLHKLTARERFVEQDPSRLFEVG